ncbi:MAG: hypothetical protein Q7S58_12810 [Candidatus Binatus sp.]|uniref:hypothetical protein n=1 Tax=Candidatus Binatus sp. TaxID=2811406 RepID=UPI0027157117|nr:hypothetical protein [Candidatus Binatus sp.]MDO8433280.1 hypothetical protein [Candidatus Binatus sp.]
MTNFELLEKAKFKEFKSSQVPFPWWVNKGARMAFSFAAVEDADLEWLSGRSRESEAADEFLFYFAYGEQMNLDLCDRILSQHGIENVAPTPQLIVPRR